MKIKTLTLYKTKLDANYNNVIDTGNDTYLDNTTFKTQVLDVYYNNIVLYDANAKSGQEVDGILTVRITKDYTELLNYNYVCINNGSKNYFYFITNMFGVNDSETPITELTLKRDAWANNIEYFTNHQETDMQQVIRSHFNRWYDDGNGARFWPFYYNSEDRANITKFNTETFLTTNAGNYVIWGWFRVSNDCKIAQPDGAVSIGDGYFGKSYFDSAAPVFVFPLAIITGYADGVPNFNFNMVFNGHAINMEQPAQILKALNFNSDKFLEAGLTLFPPFAYTCNGNEITADFVSITTASILNELNEVIYNPADDLAQICYVVRSFASTAYTTLNFEYTNDLTAFTPDSTEGTAIFDYERNYNDVKLYDPRLYCHPFVSMAFVCSNLSVPIDIIQDRTQFKAVINFGGKTAPLVSCFLNDTLISSYNNVSVSGNIPTSSNKWESFLSKAVTTVGLNTISATLTGAMSGGGAGAAMGAVGALGSGISTGINNMVDTASRPNTASQPSELASDNIPRFIPKVVKSAWVSEREVEGIAGELFAFGYKYRATKSIKSNCRVWFDYCQTEYCKLPDITNLNDRAQLEQAFNRGLTKWHFEPAFGLNASFNKYQNNPERVYVSAESAQIAFDFGGNRPSENHGTLGNVINLQGNNVINNGVIDLSNGTLYFDKTTAELDLTTVQGGTITYAMKFSEIDITQNGWLLWMHPSNTEAYNSGGFRSSIENNIIKAITNNASIAASASYNINDILANKTIAFSYYIPTGIYDYLKIRIFVDGALVGEYSAQYKSAYMNGGIWQFGSTTQGVCSAKLSKFKIWYETLGDAWTADIAAKNLI